MNTDSPSSADSSPETSNLTPETASPALPDTIPAAELAGLLGVQRSVFTEWRKSGALTFPAHFLTRGRNEIVLTVEGRVRVAELLQHPPGALAPATQETAGGAVEIEITARGANPRCLRGRVLATNERCTVLLVTPRVFASQFALRVKLMAVPAATSGVFSYEGRAPRKVRI